jgi:hypothetical protein
VPQREFQAIRAHRAAGADGDGVRRLVPGLGHVPGHGKPVVGIDAGTGAPGQPVHPAGQFTVRQSCGSCRTWRGLETISTWLHLLPFGQLVAPSSPGRQRLPIPSPVAKNRPRWGCRPAAGAVRVDHGVTLCIRPGDGGTIVAISAEVDVWTEAPLQQALLGIIRERSARLMLDCPASRSWTAPACGRSSN